MVKQNEPHWTLKKDTNYAKIRPKFVKNPLTDMISRNIWFVPAPPHPRPKVLDFSRPKFYKMAWFIDNLYRRKKLS